MRYLALIALFLSSALANAMHAEKLQLSLPSGRVIQAELRTPEAPETGKTRVPLILLFGGFENAGEVLDLVHPTTPVALASFNYPFQAERKFQFPKSLGDAPELKRMIRDTQDGIHALIVALSNRADIDSSRITVVGASFGSPFAIQAAADHPSQIQGVAIVHGFGKIRDTAQHAILRSWLPQFGGWAYPAAWLLTWGGYLYLQPPSPEEAARQLGQQQKVLMVVARDDTFIPVEASDALWAGFQKSSANRERQVMDGDHLLPGSRSLIQQILLIVQDWMKRKSLA